MNDSYLGTLDYHDPLYEVLLAKVCPDVRDPRFHVNRMSSNGVYKYTEEKSRTAIIGKFFRLDDTSQDRVSRIKGEYDNLNVLRDYGFSVPPNYVVRPITRELSIGLALIEEFISGRELDYYLRAAIYHGDRSALKDRLSSLASFLYALHSKTSAGSTINLGPLSAYFEKLLDKLCTQTVVSHTDRRLYMRLVEKWLGRSRFRKVENVIIHGDATPTNFLFTDRGDVAAIDLERMKLSDIAWDIGMICAELKHTFLWRTGSPYESEPYIRHFLKSYAGHYHNGHDAFETITRRTPFYMAMTELRIARNGYLDWNYRLRLAYEALECLRWGLKLK